MYTVLYSVQTDIWKSLQIEVFSFKGAKCVREPASWVTGGKIQPYHRIRTGRIHTEKHLATYFENLEYHIWVV